jgi:hypothetical protein
MKRKIRVGLEVEFDPPRRPAFCIKDALESWNSSRKEHPRIIHTFHLIRFQDYYYINFQNYAFCSSWFIVKEISYYEEKI